MIKNMISKSRVRLVIAAAVTLILVGLNLGAVWGEGLQWGKLLLALFLSAAAGFAIALDWHFSKKVSAVIVPVLPLLALCSMEFYTHVPWDLTFLILLLNYIFYLILYLVLIFLFGNSRWGCMAAPVFPMLFGMVNYFVVLFRSSPVVPWDIFSLGTAVTITDNYTFTLEYRLVLVITGFVWLMILGEKTRFEIKKLKVRLSALALSLLLMAGYVAGIQIKEVGDAFGMDDILFTPNVLYRNNGFMAAFLANLQYLNVEKPAGYSDDKAAQIAAAASDEADTAVSAQVSEDMPNVIVVMNEAFADLSTYGEFGVSEDYLPFIRSMKENTVKGKLYVSVKGGNTANTEFEFLTGNSMAFMPAGSVPYQQFIKGAMPSMASHLNSLGYRTAALHPYFARGWNRNQVYPYLGFEETYFKKDFDNATTLRGYVDDRSAFDKLIELYEEKDAGEKLFAFEVTMQNHGGYSKEYPDLEPEVLLTDIAEEDKGTQIRSTEKYLTLIKKSDEEFQRFIEYFENQDEKTIILMFGDHQPSDYICNPILRLLGIPVTARENSPTDFAQGYNVPFVMWSNYEMEEEEVDAISINYLSTLLMEKAGIPMTGYQTYLSSLKEDFPVVTANFFMNGQDDTFYEYGTAGKESTENHSLEDYSILQYNDLVDSRNRLQGFFGAELLTNN